MDPIIAVKSLTARFDERIVLDNININIFPNEITVIMGSSGCGKTTLLKFLIGLYPLEEGQIKIFDYTLNNIPETQYEEFGQRIGVLFQNGALLNSMTVGENIAVPLEQNTNFPDELIERLVSLKLQLVGLGDAFQLYPPQLSGGMRKRVALARALAMDPPLLFCDEPSAGLDPVTSAALDDLFLSIKEKLSITLVLITHKISSILRLADRIIFMDKGQVLFTGTLEEGRSSGIEQIDYFFKKDSRISS